MREVVQRGRDRERRQRAGDLVVITGVREQARFQHRLGQLLDKQRHAVGARHDLLDDRRRQRLGIGDLRDEIGDLAATEAAHGQHHDIRLTGPWRLEFRPEGDQHQNRQLPDALDHQGQQLKRRRVDPVHVLVESQHWLLRGQAGELLDQCLQRPPLLHLRRKGQRRIVLIGRQPEQGGEQGHDFVQPVARASEHRLELGELLFRRIIAIEPRRPFQQVDHGVELTVGMIWRAVMAERRVWLVTEPLAQHPNQA
jgi:hypothetical protein